MWAVTCRQRREKSTEPYHLEEEEEEEEEDEDEDKEFVMESQSDILVDADQVSDSRPKRSREVGYTYKNNLAVDSFSLANASSSNSEIEQEQEELAMCLMMMSRDSWQRSTVTAVVGSGVNFTTAAESSDNNSMILEGGSSSNRVAIIASRSKDLKDGSNYGFHNAEMEQSATTTKLKCVEMDNSDSGYFENGAKELESDGNSIDGFTTSTYAYKKPERVESLVQLEKKDYIYGGDRDRAQLKHSFRSRTRSESEFDSPQVQESSTSTKIRHDSRAAAAGGGKYECAIGHQVFDSHQALGGHKMKKPGGCGIGSRSTHEQLTIENSSCSPESDAEKKTGSKKPKGHKCPFCPRVFRSGQALGGHKRSHLIRGGRVNLTPEVKEERSLLDLNLPAPVEEEANGHAQFMP